ncbi:unnamed protein product [Arabidopsis halleri]
MREIQAIMRKVASNACLVSMKHVCLMCWHILIPMWLYHSPGSRAIPS